MQSLDVRRVFTCDESAFVDLTPYREPSFDEISVGIPSPNTRMTSIVKEGCDS